VLLCAQVDAAHVGIGAKLSDYQGNVPGAWLTACSLLMQSAPRNGLCPDYVVLHSAEVTVVVSVLSIMHTL
jgi:hypothetical protein